MNSPAQPGQTINAPEDNVILLVHDHLDLFNMNRINVDNKFVAFFFFTMDNAVDLEDIYDIHSKLMKFRETGCSVIGICADNAYVLEKMKEKEVGFPILCDTSYIYAKAFGINKTDELPSRATFIMERKSRKIKYSKIYDEDSKRDIDSYLNVIEELILFPEAED